MTNKVARTAVKILVKAESAYVSVGFHDFFYLGCAINTCRILAEQDIDDLIVYFLDKTVCMKLVCRIAKVVDCPLTISWFGGRSVHLESVFQAGVERVVVNGGSVLAREIAEQITEVYGASAVMLQVNYESRGMGNSVRTSCHHGLTSASEELSKFGSFDFSGWSAICSEILIQSVDCDGSFGDIDTRLIRRFLAAYDEGIPFLYGGGWVSGVSEHYALTNHLCFNGVSSGSEHFFSDFSFRGVRISSRRCNRND